MYAYIVSCLYLLKPIAKYWSITITVPLDSLSMITNTKQT